MSDFDISKCGFMTQAIHAGHHPDPAYGAISTPIYQTSTFCFDDVQDGIDKFSGETEGYVYSRGGNPTVRTLELKMAALEGGEDCVATASGMGAVGAVVLGLLQAGDHVIMGDCVYGCTNVAIREMLPKFGVEVTPVDTTDLDAVRAAVTNRTKMIFFETPTNPVMRVTDIAGVVEIAKGRDIKVVVDNTFAPPPIQYPLRLGADIVLHSVTKYLNGHGDVIGGVIIGSADDIANIKTFASTKICGTIMSPFDAFLVIRGLQTLGLRVDRHCSNALTMARYLQSKPQVAHVYYPGLEDSPDFELATRQMNGRYTGILSFDLVDGIGGLSSFEAARRFMEALNVVYIAVSLGDPPSLIEHPRTMTHHNVPLDVQASMGITEGMMRFSVGLEDVADLIADFEQAFDALG